MIRITDKSLCTGCTACVNACPVRCIVMRKDREGGGFDYPVANPDLCIGCGKCEEVCPPLNLSAAAESVSDREFSERFMKGAEAVVGKGGVVFGPVMEDDGTVGHVEADDMDTVRRMLGGSRIQSDPYGTFEEAKGYLDDGRIVLFTGPPCLIDGLRAYLGNEYENLMTISPPCRGVSNTVVRPSCRECGARQKSLVMKLKRLFKK